MNPDATSEEPLARGLFLCDLVIVDAGTNKVSLINLFDRVRVPRFPAQLNPFVVYACLTNGFGDMDLRVEIEDEHGEQVHTHAGRVRFSDRLAAVHCRFTIAGCSFPRAGAYQVILYAGRTPVAQTKLDVLKQG